MSILFVRIGNGSHADRGFIRRSHDGSEVRAALAVAAVLLLGPAFADSMDLVFAPPGWATGGPARDLIASATVLQEIVLPSAETDPSHHADDTADDSAIWIHPSDPSLSVVIGDDKEGGLMVWGLDGKEVQYVEGTQYNNVDLRYNFPLEGTYATGEPHSTVALVGVSDQGERQFDFFKVNPFTRRLESAGSFDISIRPYGGCMYLSVSTGAYYFIAPNFSGVTEQWAVRDGGDGQVVGSLARSFDVGNITEGCVADDLLGHLYMGQEDVGIWRYGAEPDAGDARTLVDSTEGGNLVADVEGLSLYYAGPDVGYLFASSQGESRVAVYAREGANPFLGKFGVGANGTIDEVTGSDGLDVTNFPLAGPFGTGLFAIHDTNNEGANASNVKLVSYGAIASALGLTIDLEWDPRLVGGEELPPPPPFDFLVAVDPVAGEVEPGGSLSATVTAALVSGASHQVAFSCEGLPAGAACVYTPPACTPTCEAALTLATDPTTPAGTYDVGVLATDGSITRTATFLLTVTPPPPFDFEVSVDPSSGTVEPGGFVRARVTATLVSGDPRDVRFACQDLPAATECDFTPPACSPTCTAEVMLSTGPTTPDGTYAVGLEASDGSTVRPTTFLLTVETPPPPFDFTLTVDPASGSLEPGGSLTVAVDAILISGSGREVEFSCENLPAATGCDFTPPSCLTPCSADLVFSTDPSVAEGTYTVTLLGTAGTITRTVPFQLTVVRPPPFDFDLSVDPTSGVVEAGGSVVVSVEANRLSGASRPVSFSCEERPEGTSCTFTEAFCSPTCGAGLSIVTSPTTPAGTHDLLVTATDGSVTRTAAFALTVSEPPPPLPIPTTLVLEPETPDPSKPGGAVTVRALLARDDTKEPLPGRAVHLEWSDDGGDSWRPAGTFETDADGRATGTLVFLDEGEDQRIRARFEGDATFAASVSDEEAHTTRSDPPPPSPPIALFTVEPPSPRVGDPVTFNASSSRSDPGTTLRARWDWDGDGSWDTDLTSTLLQTYVFAAEGWYTVRLEVRDSNELTDVAERTVVVGPPPIRPDTTRPVIVILVPSHGSVLTSEQVRVSGTASDDRAVYEIALSPDRRNWTEALGTESWFGILTLREGTRTIFARATDGAGNEAVTAITVVIQLSEAPNPEDPPAEPSRPAGSAVPPGLLTFLPILLGIAWAFVALALAAAYLAEREKGSRLELRRQHGSRGDRGRIRR